MSDIIGFAKGTKEIFQNPRSGKGYKKLLSAIGSGVRRGLNLGMLGFGFSISVFGSFLKVFSIGMNLVIDGFLTVGRFMLKFGIAAIKGIWTVGKGLIKGLVASATLPFKTFHKMTVGLYNFITNNTFMKRLNRFLKTDAGAAFLGAACAFIKFYLINPLLNKILGGSFSFKDPELKNIGKNTWDNFL